MTHTFGSSAFSYASRPARSRARVGSRSSASVQVMERSATAAERSSPWSIRRHQRSSAGGNACGCTSAASTSGTPRDDPVDAPARRGAGGHGAFAVHHKSHSPQSSTMRSPCGSESAGHAARWAASASSPRASSRVAASPSVLNSPALHPGLRNCFPEIRTSLPGRMTAGEKCEAERHPSPYPGEAPRRTSASQRHLQRGR
jgi:hypothetical protein